MSARRKSVPSYLFHKQSGRARAVWTDSSGVRRDRLLPGLHESPESLEAFARLQLELATSPTPSIGPGGVTIGELLLAYLEHAARYYVDPDGNPTKELVSMKASVKPLKELYSRVPATDFGPKSLAAVREAMIRKGWCRQLVNRRTDRIKRVFKWGVAEELIPATVFHALRTLPGLRAGRTVAPEAQPVKPVAEETVKATLPCLPTHVRVMVELMWHTGMRPGEVCGMTLNQIDRTGQLWVYCPNKHKGSHRGKGRTIVLGPNAVAVLSTFLEGRDLAPDAPIFSPRQAMEEWNAERTAKRKTPKYPSHMKRNATKRKPARERAPTERYTPNVISRTVKFAAERAEVEHWHPYQIRHTFATRVRRGYSLEAAGAALGHAKMSATEIYAERDETLAAKVAAEIG